MSHATHCNAGDYEGSCKYGEDATCSALNRPMSDALKSRLSAERLFTAQDMADVAAHTYRLCGGDEPGVGYFREEVLASHLEQVRQHLSSDTTTIRPLKA